jgi:IS1 family transposase
MSHLSHDQQARVIACLVEGNSVRSTERLTGIHRDTILRHLLAVGEGCNRLHDALMRDLHVNLLEVDEVWSYLGKKQRRVRPEDPAEFGDQYVFTALDATRKAIVSYAVGKRDSDTADAFAYDLRDRIANRPQISTDGFKPYLDALPRAFGGAVDHVVIVKEYGKEGDDETLRRYSPPKCISMIKRRATGAAADMDRANTSYVERSNLTLRMGCRRFTRLTTGYSKRLKNHAAAVALSIAYYNFCRVHEAIRTAPAVALGVTDHVWTIAELIDAALSIVPDDEPGPGPERAPAPAPVLTPPAAPAPLPALSLPILPTHVQRAAKLRQAIAVIQASAQLSLFAEGPAEATAAKAGW